MAGDGFFMTVQGMPETLRALNHFTKQSTRNRLMRPAIRAGASVVNKAAKRNAAAAGFTDSSGITKASIGIKTATGKTGPYAVVGARKGFSRQHKNEKVPRQPFFYVKLVERGTRRSQAKPFLEPAFLNNMSALGRAINNKLHEMIEKEALKMAAKARKKR